MSDKGLVTATTESHKPFGTAIENDFPIVEISQLAERESYRKEIFRPIYHIHKWWANRLGSVFRAIVIGAISDGNTDIWGAFYRKHDFHNKVVLDPFMGSGTTLGEAAKLGARPIGCDINPISTFAVTQALTKVDIADLKSTFAKLEKEVEPEISAYYTTLDPETGQPIRALYYFWVMVLETPEGESLPLFSSYIFSKHAYPKKNPKAQIICPSCWSVSAGRYDAKKQVCAKCGHEFAPQHGPARGQYVVDSQGKKHKIKDLLPPDGSPPQLRMYAIMALRNDGEKVYLSPQSYDFDLFRQAQERLVHEELPLPKLSVRSGHNTNQARGYNYKTWRDFFNERQLLCLGLLLKQILRIEDEKIRDQFLCLFSGTLEFNNLFCSFKGEGTGAVRHMFSNHILKPERTPLENSVWGTSKSSGTFLSLFKSRLLKAQMYLDEPTEVFFDRDSTGNLTTSKSKYITASNPIKLELSDNWETFSNRPNQALVLNGDSAELPIPDASVDAVVTDPPYFDFVHYSELSDFFYAWLAPVVSDRYPFFKRPSSYHKGEVQNTNPEKFATNLCRVFKECNRVLKRDGILTFSFHHSRPEGWSAIYQALRNAGFHIVATYPVHAEMTVASPKSRTKEPISLDMILVCRKQEIEQPGMLNKQPPDELVEKFVERLRKADLVFSQTDLFNMQAALLLITASHSCLPVSDYRMKAEKLYKLLVSQK